MGILSTPFVVVVVEMYWGTAGTTVQTKNKSKIQFFISLKHQLKITIHYSPQYQTNRFALLMILFCFNSHIEKKNKPTPGVIFNIFFLNLSV